jgi:hypothetical protein
MPAIEGLFSRESPVRVAHAMIEDGTIEAATTVAVFVRAASTLRPAVRPVWPAFGAVAIADAFANRGEHEPRCNSEP